MNDFTNNEFQIDENHVFTKEELETFFDNVARCLVRYGHLSEIEAGRLVKSSTLLHYEDQLDIGLLFHEVPYYWAMCILHAKSDPYWHQRPELWPPPDDEL